jgi:hypothetical protein
VLVSDASVAVAACHDDGHVVRLATAAHPVIDPVQPVLGTIGDLQDMLGLAKLAIAEGHPDSRGASVVPGGLDEQPASEA